MHGRAHGLPSRSRDQVSWIVPGCGLFTYIWLQKLKISIFLDLPKCKTQRGLYFNQSGSSFRHRLFFWLVSSSLQVVGFISLTQYEFDSVFVEYLVI